MSPDNNPEHLDFWTFTMPVTGVHIVRFTESKVFAIDRSLLMNNVGDGEVLILNFQRVEFFSSACIGAMVVMHRQLKERPGRIISCECRDEISDVFRAGRLHLLRDWFNYVDSEKQALEKAIGFLRESRHADWPQRFAGTPCDIARSIANGKRIEVLPILANAMEEAGCADTATLEHLRHHGPECFVWNDGGCWVVDHLLFRVHTP